MRKVDNLMNCFFSLLTQQDCPSGYLTEETFKTIYTGYFSHSEATEYATLVFHTCTDGESHLTFDKFVKMLSCLARGTTSEKLRWLFNLYDRRHVGSLSVQDIENVVTAIYSLSHGHSNHVHQVAQVKAYRLFKSMDTNGDNQVSFDEFCSWCLKSDGQLNIFDTRFE